MDVQTGRNGQQRVVVTGIGAISPLGLSVDATWEGLLACRSAIAPITAFDASSFGTRIAAPVRDFQPGQTMDVKEARRLSPFIQYAIAAAHEAVTQADLDFATEDAQQIGCEIGSALGGTGLVEEQRLVLESRGPRATNPTIIPAVLINSAACAVAIRYGILGPVCVPVAACATGVTALGEAYRRVQRGEVVVELAGGTDSVMTPLSINAFGRLGALSTRNDIPERACAPFSAGRDGTVVGEGAVVFVLESLDHALAREATILAEITGYGLTSDAYHLAAPDPNGAGAARAMRLALQEDGHPGVAPDWICAHGTGTVLNDLAETRAIKIALGERAWHTPVSSVKGGLGHMLGAAGAVSAMAAVGAIRSSIIPPTLNYTAPDPECDLDYVPNSPRPAAVESVLVNAFGFGGQNAALVIRRWA
jgi:3-oxoacyl-[acyl-carrier-protein] synthase II